MEALLQDVALGSLPARHCFKMTSGEKKMSTVNFNDPPALIRSDEIIRGQDVRSAAMLRKTRLPACKRMTLTLPRPARPPARRPGRRVSARLPGERLAGAAQEPIQAGVEAVGKTNRGSGS